jgi:hypothetical protein
MARDYPAIPRCSPFFPGPPRRGPVDPAAPRLSGDSPAAPCATLLGPRPLVRRHALVLSLGTSDHTSRSPASSACREVCVFPFYVEVLRAVV